MKFEDLIKKKVAEHQETYNPKIWQKLSSKLDAATSVAKPSSSLKWIMVAASVIGIASLGVFIYTKESVKQQVNTQEEKVVTSEKSTPEAAETTSGETVKKPKIVTPENNAPELEVKTTHTDKIQHNQTPTSVNVLPTITTIVEEDRLSENNTSVHTDKEQEPTENKLVALNWEKRICQNENTILKNTTAATLFLVGDNTEYRVKAGETIQVSNMRPGEYKIQLEESGTKAKFLQSLEIVPIHTIDFLEDVIVYEKGLPFIPVKVTNSNLSSLSWKVQEKNISNKKEAMIPAYDKGMEKVELEGISNGCTVKASYNLTIKEEYNLLAVNAFNIDSRDERNKTFLPYALYERGEAFDMQIIDPKTGEVIFKTNSIENPWNGVDSRTGELVPINTRYIWTVSLAKKANFETKSVYQGVIVRVMY